MSKLQTQSEPVNQTAFANAIRLGVVSVLDATATVDKERADNIEMATRWFVAAESYVSPDSLNEQCILDGLRVMLRGFNLYL